MKATLNAQELRNAVRWVSKVAKSSTLPILEGVMLRAEEAGRITVQATNLSTTLTQYVDAEVTDRDGGVCIEGKLLKKYLAKVGKKKDAILEIDCDGFITELGKVTLKSVTANPVEDWPRVTGQHEDYDVALHINLDDLPLKKLAPFMGKEVGSRPVLESMLVEQRAEGLTFSAADGFSLVCHGSIEGEAEDSWLIPSGAIQRMAELKGDATLGFNSDRVCLQAGNSFVDSGLTEGKFPDYSQIMPADDRGTWATFDTTELVNALEVLKAVSDKYKAYLTILKLDGDEATLSDNSGDCIATIYDWSCWEREEPLDIAFSADLMLSCLALCGEEARIMFESPSRPMKIVDDNVVMVLMPMQIKR